MVAGRRREVSLRGGGGAARQHCILVNHVFMHEELKTIYRQSWSGIMEMIGTSTYCIMAVS